MDYFDFDVEDFASDDRFIRWVLHNDPEAGRYWKSYLTGHPEIRPKVEQARVLLLNLYKSRTTASDTARLNKIWNNISAEVAAEDTKAASRFTFVKVAAAVSIIALASVGIWFSLPRSPDAFASRSASVASPTEGFVEEFNTTGTSIRMHLSDGSIVTLENQSRLKYRTDYSGDSVRQVYLEGEAFFEVARNQKQPFLVYSNEVVTKVLGTSFRIKAFGNENNVIVSVKEGKVSVYSSVDQKEKPHDTIVSAINGVVLSSNQEVLYSREVDTFNKSLVQLPQIITDVKQEISFKFDNTPIRDVFATLQKAYGVEIIFQEDVMANCFLTVPMADEALFEKLKIICRTIEASYEMIDAKIVISGKGC